MKKKIRFVALIIALIMVAHFSVSGAMQVFAHSAMLDVKYDNCVASENSDGLNEMWYVLDKGSVCQHLDQNTPTIRYYFFEENQSGIKWTGNVSNAVAQEIKNAYANSMKKWNNVYFYSYDADGKVTKHKLINIVEGTQNVHNLAIYPGIDADAAADTVPVGSEYIVEAGGTTHKHYAQWQMTVSVHHFFVHGSWTQAKVNATKEKAGAHEVGHILGLRDIDNNNLCNAGAKKQHHYELLMGYGESEENQTGDITYKDIAGVAITRGFHTKDDHKWLNAGRQSNGKYKLICSICNGVLEVSSLSEYQYNTYGSCNSNHTLSSGNMMAVASYGIKDYYKCKYCRYVAPFANNVRQNYVATTSKDSTQHWCVNNVTGLTYTTTEAHGNYTYTYKDSSYHTATCECGYEKSVRHWVKETEIVNERYGRCGSCGALIDLDNSIVGVVPNNIAKLSLNGSYILPNGIVVLVDADIEAYENGTLVFYDKNDVPVTQ